MAAMAYLCVHCGTANPDPYPGATSCVQCAKDMRGGPASDSPSNLGYLFKVGFWLALVAVPVVALLVVTSWWTMARDPLRGILRRLPADLVARQAPDTGSPVRVAVAVAIPIVAILIGFSVGRRRAIKAALVGGSRFPTWLLGFGRAAVVVGLFPLIPVTAAIAYGSDLREPPAAALTQWWQITAVLVVVVLYAWLGTRRLQRKMARRLNPPEQQIRER